MNATVPELGENLQPDLGALRLGNPKTQHFLDAVQVDPNGPGLSNRPREDLLIGEPFNA